MSLKFLIRNAKILCFVLALLFIAVINVHIADAQLTVLSQPRVAPGDPYPCNLWFGWCDPGTWPSNAVYAAAWDDADGPSGFIQILAEDFIMASEASITAIKVWGGYWWQDIPPANDNFTVIFHNDAGGAVGVNAAPPEFNVPSTRDSGTWVTMKWCPTCNGNALVFEYTLNLANPVTLAPGTYWVEVYNDTTGHLNNNDFFWTWGYLDPANGIDGLAWTNASAPGSSWIIDSNGNLAIEATACTGWDCQVIVNQNL